MHAVARRLRPAGTQRPRPNSNAMEISPLTVIDAQVPPEPSVGDTPGLELALLRRSLPTLSADVERCANCGRGLLIGERVYEYASGEIRCELCRADGRGPLVTTHVVHGPAFGHSIRVLDRRAAVRAA